MAAAALPLQAPRPGEQRTRQRAWEAECIARIEADFRFSETDGFDLDFGIGGASATSVGLDVRALLRLTLGVDLDDLTFSVGSILDNLFVRDASLAVTIGVAASDLDLAAAGVSVGGDSVAGTLAVSFDLVDPSATPDGRISVSECEAALISCAGATTVTSPTSSSASASFIMPAE